MRGIEQIPWVYDAMLAVWEALGFKSWRVWLVAGARGRTLEVGCGTGRNLPLYDPGILVVGLDPSADGLGKAHRRAPNVPLVRASAAALPFREGTFDSVVSGLVFCSVSDPLNGLGEVRRVLKDSGRLRMVEHVRSSRPLTARWQDFIQPAWTRIAGGCHPNRDTEANVGRAGFAIEPESRTARGNLRRFCAAKNEEPGPLAEVQGP